MRISIESALLRFDEVPFTCFTAGQLVDSGAQHVFDVIPQASSGNFFSGLNLFYDCLAPALAVKFNSSVAIAGRILREIIVPPSGPIAIEFERMRTAFNNAMIIGQERPQTAPCVACGTGPAPDRVANIDDQLVRDIAERPEIHQNVPEATVPPREEFVPHMVGPYMPPSGQAMHEPGSEQAVIAVSKLFSDSTSTAKSLAELRMQYNKTFSDLCNIERNIVEKMEMLCGKTAVKRLFGHVEELSKSEALEKVYFTDKRLIIITKPLMTKDKILNVNQKEGEGYRRLIGRMSIEISLASLSSTQYASESNVIIHNLDRGLARSADNNPGSIMECGHVMRNVQTCFGSLNGELVKAFAMFNVKLIFDLVVRFIQEPNMDDCLGRPMRYWQPYAEESVVVEKPAEPQNIAQPGAIEAHG